MYLPLKFQKNYYFYYQLFLKNKLIILKFILKNEILEFTKYYI